MELKFIHFYPDLMSLYGSYANVAILKRCAELLGNTVTVETVTFGDEADIASADFLYMGAGTERSQKAALADFSRFADAVKNAAAKGIPQLYAGTAMDLLGKSITDAEGNTFDGIGLASFTTVQQNRRIVGDVYGETSLFEEAIVGFINKSSVISGVESPLLSGMKMGFGNEVEGGAEGFCENAVFASHLTGPILTKNPRLLQTVLSAIYAHRGKAAPAALPSVPYLEEGYAVSAEQLRLRCENTNK